tara:strand:+ start:5425 stop:5646 length:222 start_codon:yes stop_codon:yes gene_type:complete
MKTLLLVLALFILTSCGSQQSISDTNQERHELKVEELNHIIGDLETHIEEQNHAINTYRTKLKELQPTNGIKH